MNTRREQESRQREFVRLVHDDVLSVLTAAIRLPGPPPPELRQAAVAGLEALRPRRVARRQTERELEAADARQTLARVAEGIAADADVRIALRTGTVPADVVESASQALSEALRNSLAHAGASSETVVTGVVGGDVIRLVVSDHGPGFDPAAVGPERLGVRLSILDRMRDLPGGTARVTSSAEGTDVELVWRRNPEGATDSASSAARWMSRRELAGIRRTAQPVLEALAAGANIDDEFVRELEVVEGSIRDRIRAPGLNHPVLAAAVRASRERGVQVLLLGDEDRADGRLSDGLAAAIGRLIGDVDAYTITIRETPTDQGGIVTVVVECGDGRVRRAEFRRDRAIGGPGADV